jgi:prolyl-tRNA editing enzyme YbaK/EbsC (Cys-tRNA(Pro) deacylase)
MGGRDEPEARNMTDGESPGSDTEADEIERRVDNHLSGQEVSYEVVACDPELADTDAFCSTYGYELEDAANTIVVIGKSDPPRHVACVLLATTRLDVNHAVKARLGVRRASFADRDQTRRLTGMAIGGVTPLALPDDLPIWVDSRVMTRPRIVLGGGSRRRKIVGPPTLLTGRPGVEVIDGLALEVDSLS